MAEVTPYLAEHQPVSKSDLSTEPAGYNPTTEERRAIKLVNQLLDKAKRHRKLHDQKWLDYYKFFRGKQWKETRPSYRHSEVINMVWQNIQSTVPILTDSRPRIQFIPQDPSQAELAQILNDVSESDWEANNWLQVLTEIIYDAHIYGTGLGLMDFDPKALYGLGNICFESWDPFYSYPDPIAQNINDRRMRYFLYAEPVDVDVLKRDYPDKADFIKPDVGELPNANKFQLDQVRYKSPVDSRTILEGESAYDFSSQDQCLKVTLYLIKSDEVVEEEKQSSELDPVTKEPKKEFIQKLKYPKGRKICIAGGILLDDKPLEFEDGKVPCAKLINYTLPREFWGESEIAQLEGPQKIFNRLVSFALDVLTLMGNPVWVVDTASGVDTDNLFNRPGLIIEKEPGSEVRREEGVSLQPYVLQLIDRMKAWFDDISGSNEVSRGIKPEAVDSGVAIQSLQDANQTRLRQKTRNIDAFLQDIGSMYLSRVFQFYSAPRIIRISHKPDAQKYFKFHIENQLDEQGNPLLDDAGNPVRKAKITPFSQDVNGNMVLGETKEIAIQGEFDVRVATGSSLPFAKQEKSNLSISLFRLKAIDRRELLKNVDYPNWELVADRMDQADQAAQQGAMMAQAQGGPPQAA